jgi:hypothetical protein
MSEAQAKWSADGSYIPPIDPHTQAKHRILECTLKSHYYALWNR